MRLRTPGGRWLSYSATEFARTVGAGYVSFALQEPQAGMWTVEVSTNRSLHTPYTVGGFVRSPLRLELAAPVFVGAGQPIDVKAVVSDAKGPLSRVKARATVTTPPPYSDLLRKYADQLRGVKLPDVADGKPDKQRLALTRLVLLRNELLAQTGEDILASRVVGMPIGHGSGRFGVRDAAALRGLGVPGSLSASVTSGVGMLDPRIVARPWIPGVAAGRFTDTRLPGSYSVAVTAAGFSPACGTRFVRKDLVSVVVGDRKRRG